jgi:cobalt/nickel transport system ATP-binding protein
MSTALAATGLTVRYAPHAPAVLAGLDLRVDAGERVALLGLNGSGKTTLLLAAAGLLPSEGTLEVCGLPVTPAHHREVRDRIGFLFSAPEDQIFFPRVLDDTSFGLARRGLDRDTAHRRAMALLGQLGIAHAALLSPFHLSHGQRQRVALAGALAAEPQLLLLDEPSAALDTPGKRALAALLHTLPAAMVLATHDMGFARAVCTRYVVLSAGRAAYDGTDAGKALAALDPPASGT